MIRTLILDDDPNSRLAAHQALSEYDDVTVVAEFSHGAELFSYLETAEADLLVLDIELDQEMGFDLAEKINREHPSLMILFLTGHASYAIDGYDYKPVHFLTKPIHLEKLRQSLEEVRRRMALREGAREEVAEPSRIMFRLKQGYRFVDVGTILYLERRNRHNLVITQTETFRISDITMRELEDMLSPYGFLLCHQSFLISLRHVTGIHEVSRQLYEVSLSGTDFRVPVARGHYEQMLEILRKNNR